MLYGSNAIGGVVNAVTSDEDDPHKGFRGHVTGLGATNNKQGGVAGVVEYGWKKVCSMLMAIPSRGDFKTPFAASRIPPTRSYGGTTSPAIMAPKALVGSFTGDRRRYGTPYSPLFEEGALLPILLATRCDPTVQPDCEYDIFLIRDQFSSRLPDVPDEAIVSRCGGTNFGCAAVFVMSTGPIQREFLYRL